MRATVAVALVLSVVVMTGATPTEGQAPAPEQKPQATVVKRERVYPKSPIRRKVRFEPWAQPTKAQVYKIIAVEARRWHAPAWRLHCRIRGESQYRWWIVNSGGYAGLGQFGSETFYRGMSTIKTRRVKFRRVRYVRRHTKLKTYWSDNHVTSKRSHKVRVKKIVTRIGKIPRGPVRTHGWAQVRIMAQAMVGRSAVRDSEWQVRC